MRKIFVKLALFLGIAGLAGTGLAKDVKQDKITKASLGEKEIGEDAAKVIALKKVSGRVKEVEHEKQKGVAVYSVEIVTADGNHEVVVNAVTGVILEDKLQTGHHEENDNDDDD